MEISAMEILARATKGEGTKVGGIATKGGGIEVGRIGGVGTEVGGIEDTKLTFDDMEGESDTSLFDNVDQPISAYEALLGSLSVNGGTFSEAFARRQKEEQGLSSSDESGSNEEKTGWCIVDESIKDSLNLAHSEHGGAQVPGYQEQSADLGNGEPIEKQSGTGSDENKPGLEVPEVQEESEDEGIVPDDSYQKNSFKEHLEYHLTEQEVALLSKGGVRFRCEKIASDVQKAKWLTTESDLPMEERDLLSYGVKLRLKKSWIASHDGLLWGDFQSNCQCQFFSLCNSYRDILFPKRPSFYADGHMQDQEIMDAYLLHVLNHVLKTRDLVTKNNEKQDAASGAPRDQGFTRPKVLILLPLRSIALRLVRRLLEMVPATHKVPVRRIDHLTGSVQPSRMRLRVRQKAPGLLQPLLISDKPWESIAMDFIFDLPRTPPGNDGIWTIICRFNKQAHFVPVRKKINSEHMVKLFLHNIFKYHGMPQSIVSERDPQEADSTVLDLLKCCVSEHKATWEHYLTLAEYAYNNTVHTSIGKVPFEMVEGGKKGGQSKNKIFEADKYVQNMDEAYRKIKIALEKIQSKQKKVADRHHRELVFSLGDWVLLRFQKARLKLREGWKIHNAFHVSLLRPFVGDVPEDMVLEEQPEVKVKELDEILVHEQILALKERKARGKVARRYLVKFKNYSPMDAKWKDSPQLVQLYLEAIQLQPTVTS
ncbi:hypothetical protein L7F22_058742 [Adiantum nelumboides]|nr:hypothetical protein [Adiantum nelumboides]